MLTLEWGRQSYDLLSLALDTLMLGRANSGLALKDVGKQQAAVCCEVARVRLDEAVDGLRASEQNDEVPRGLIARCAFRRALGDWDGAERDLDEVEEIAEPGPMKLFLCDTALERVRLAFAQVEAFAPLNGLNADSSPKPMVPNMVAIARLKEEAAKQLANSADYIKTCGYHRRDEELAELQAVLRGGKKFADLPPRV
jgi:hypothetical protein